MKELLNNIAQDKGFIIQMCEVGEKNYVHCFVSAPPTIEISKIVKYIKGISGRKLFEKFPHIRQYLWKGQLWNHSYYVETIGSISSENIKKIYRKSKEVRIYYGKTSK